MMKNKVYKNFEEVRADFPLLHEVELSQSFDGDMTLCIRFSEDEDSFLCVQEKAIILEGDDWFGKVCQDASLEKLTLSIELSGDEARPLQQLTALKTLHLSVSRRHKCATKTLHIPSLPTLEKLHAQGWQGVTVKEPMPSLVSASFAYLGKLDLLEVLQNLPANRLEKLRAERIQRLWVGKGHDSLAILENFTRLRVLNFKGNRLGSLPCSFAPLQVLEEADLSDNVWTRFPDGLLDLPYLHTLDLQDTPLTKNKAVRSGEDLLKFAQELRDRQASPQARQTLLQILMDDKKAGERLTLEGLVHLFPFTSHANTWRRLVAIGEHLPLSLDAHTLHIAFIGKSSAFDTLQETLGQHGVTLSRKIGAKTQAVCVGEQPTTAQIAALLARRDTLKICFPFHLKQYAESLEMPYLLEASEEDIAHLCNLLQSEDEANVEIALQIMRTGGIPPIVFEYLCLEVVRNAWACRPALLKLLEQHSTRAQFLVLKKISLGNNDYWANALILLESPEFNTRNIVAAALRFFTYKHARSYDNRFLYMLKGCLWETQGEALELLLDRYLTPDGTYILENKSMRRERIPVNLKGNPRIKRIIVFEELMRNAFKKTVQHLPALVELEVLFNYGEEDGASAHLRRRLHYETAYPHLKIGVFGYESDTFF